MKSPGVNLSYSGLSYRESVQQRASTVLLCAAALLFDSLCCCELRRDAETRATIEEQHFFSEVPHFRRSLRHVLFLTQKLIWTINKAFTG